MSTASQSADSPTILILEDNDIYRQVVCAGLKRQLPESCLLPAASLAEAREFLGRQPIHVAITDLTLPDGSGLDLLPDLKEDIARGCKTIALSNESAQDVLAGLKARGYHGFVAKEHGMKALVEAIRSVLAGETYISHAA